MLLVAQNLRNPYRFSNRLLKYLYRVDHVQNKNKARRLRYKVKHLVDDMHWKAANFLVRNYETIFIGDMSAKRVIRGKGKGSLSCKAQSDGIVLVQVPSTSRVQSTTVPCSPTGNQ